MSDIKDAKGLIKALSEVLETHRVPGCGAAIAVFDKTGCQTLLGLDQNLKGGTDLMDSALVLLTGAWVNHAYSFEGKTVTEAFGDGTTSETSH
jgi:hypothetical protein